MANDEVKTRITADAQQALNELGKVTAAEKEMAGATKLIGEESGKAQQKSTAFGRAIEGMVSSWLGFAAVVGVIVTGLRDITTGATKAAQATADLGRSVRGLSVNVGGRLAHQLVGDITSIAAESRFDTAGRNQLIESVSALTDLRPGQSREQIVAAARQLAVIQRASGVGGQPGAQLFQSLTGNLGLNDAQATDAAVALLTSGLDANVATELVGRGGRAGGVDLVSLVLAGREAGLNVATSSRGVQTLVSTLTRTDERGNVTRDLAAAGITAEQDVTARLRTLNEARKAGRINQQQFLRAIGGEENLRIVGPLLDTLDSGAFAAAKRSILDPDAAENAIAELEANEFVRAQERANVRDLARTVDRERPSSRGELLLEIEAAHPDSKIARGAATIGRLPELIGGFDPTAETARNITIIQKQYNNGPDRQTSERGRAEEVVP